MTKVKIQIKSIWGSVIFEAERENYTFAQAVTDANMTGADMRGANMRGANMRGANMTGADMRGADMRGADMRGANMTGADMTGANMTGADMRGANMRGANMRGANMRGANMRGANMRGIKGGCPRAFLNEASREMLFIFEHLKPELPALREQLLAGQINGTQYEGECACLIGSLAKGVAIKDDPDTDTTEAMGDFINQVCESIPYYEKGLHNVSEQWFYQIREGDTPDNNEFAAHALKLIDQVLASK